MLPAVDLNGKIIMDSPFEIKLAPNGNGALFDSIANRPNIKAYIEGLDYVQVIGVDNPINKVLDPVQIGFTADQ
jgi:UDP-N-acetylglucosamine/UDP-N-acetylgalactosamine diphosphorylase